MVLTGDRKCVLALGFFDGVHLGHGALLRRTAERAREMGLTPAVMTFDTHPDTLVSGTAVPLINSAPDRAKLIRDNFGIEQVEFFRFTEETMHLPWDAFLEEMCREMEVAHFVVGYDFRFGWRGEGDTEKLRRWCGEKGLSCDVIGKVERNGITVSSTYIRTLLAGGNIREANAFLGHPHLLTDVVQHGHRLGRRLGAPTVNMQFAPGVLVPRFGVYAANAILPEGSFAAVTNIGIRPTVSEEQLVTVETHVLDYSGNLYGRMVSLEFLDYLRGEVKFAALEELSRQIRRDAAAAKTIWEERP